MSQLMSVLSLALFSGQIGILSANIQDSRWLSSVLYMRHVHQKFGSLNLKYLYYGEDGEPQLFSHDDLQIWWHAPSQELMCSNNDDMVRFAHCCPVHLNGTSLTTGYHTVIGIIEGMNAAWVEQLEDYVVGLRRSQERMSWLVIMLIGIPQNPSSLLQDGSKVPASVSTVQINGEKYHLRWKHPTVKWDRFRGTIPNEYRKFSELHQTLGTESNVVLDIESETLASFPGPERPLRVFSARAYRSCMLVLFHHITGARIWFRKFPKSAFENYLFGTKVMNNSFFVGLCDLPGFKGKMNFEDVPNWDDWFSKYNTCLENPTEMYLALCDELVLTLERLENHQQIVRPVVEMEISKTSSQLMRLNNANLKNTGQGSKLQFMVPTGTMRLDKNSIITLCALRLQFLLFTLQNGGKFS